MKLNPTHFTAYSMARVILPLLTLLFFCLAPGPIFAASSCNLNCEAKKGDNLEYARCLGDKKVCLENKLRKIRSKKSTLANEISLINGRINLQQLKIKQTLTDISLLEDEIATLSDQVKNLNLSLDRLTDMLLKRIQAHYKRSRLSAVHIPFVADNLESIFLKQRYLDEASKQTADLIKKAETQRLLYDQQKQKKELVQAELKAKKEELERQRQELASQKAAQQKVLAQTKQSERVYQNQLATVIAEFQAIQSIISGGGKEVSSGPVKAGDRIASIIAGPSCNSSGTHLHFMVTKNKAVQNPFTYLKPGVSINNCSGSSCGSSDGDPVNPSGNWIWPLNGPIQLTQGFGSTWATRHTWVRRVYTYHNGIDIRGSSLTVRAVANGTLYRGSFTGSGGCRLRYVKIDHGNGLVSWYLHVNY